MALWLLPALPSLSLVTCQATPASVRASPLTAPRISLPTNPSSSSSTTCSLLCSHFESCSGCTQEYNLHRPLVIDDAVDFFRQFGLSDFSFDSCRLWGWRCRAKLAIRGSSDNPLIGLYEEGTHNVVDIPDCKAHHPNINAAVQLLKQGISELNIEPYDEDKGTGHLRYVQMAVSTYNTSLPAAERYRNGKVQISLVWNSRDEKSPGSEKISDLTNFLWRNGGPRKDVHLIHSVWANFQTSTNNIIFGNRWRYLVGERDFWEHVGGIDVSLAPSSFGQANTRAFDSLLRRLQKYVPLGTSVVDLYAGAGVIGLSLAATRKCRSVKCVEVNKESKQSFEKTAERLSKSVDCNISWHLGDASTDPSSWLTGSEVIVVDPPRKGLDPSLVNALQDLVSLDFGSKSSRSSDKEEKRPWVLRAKDAEVHIQRKVTEEESHSSPQTLIYISCGWESFKKDCISLLSSKSWHLHKAHGFNFFPGTQSIEILAVFRRGPGKNLKKKVSGKKKKKHS
ncbi:uncharacterized RNA methyltransferase pc1998 [Impatiens glandulifera]|uniref:uncharacterized RNA methyltransferase pc1998 n=1 Tax=Impatiens glandulifera TaxID=253017 RepID=UPI001FB061EB|nr:uncharacterized RNA methyltransferase pc1998 [Impatiens glandulifera]